MASTPSDHNHQRQTNANSWDPISGDHHLFISKICGRNTWLRIKRSIFWWRATIWILNDATESVSKWQEWHMFNFSFFISLLINRVAQLDAIVQICLKYSIHVEVSMPKNYSICNIIREFSSHRYYSVVMAFWKNDRVTPINFQPIFTEEGLCFTFNTINSRDIYSDQ